MVAVRMYRELLLFARYAYNAGLQTPVAHERAWRAPLEAVSVQKEVLCARVVVRGRLGHVSMDDDVAFEETALNQSCEADFLDVAPFACQPKQQSGDVDSDGGK